MVHTNELYLLQHPEMLFEKKMIFWGASGEGSRILKMIENTEINVCYFCDSSPKKVGEIWEGIEIISKEKMAQVVEDEEYIVIITSDYAYEIMNTMIEENIAYGRRFTSVAFRLALNYLRYSDKYKTKLNKQYMDKYELGTMISKSRNKDNSQFFGDYLTNQRLLMMLNTNQDIVLSFSPPKVGSSTIYASLVKNDIFSLHFHDIEMTVRNNDDGKMDFWEKYIKTFTKHKKIKIISGIREPISRDCSSVFQFLGMTPMCEYGMNPDIPFVEEMRRRIMDNTARKDVAHVDSYGQYMISNQKYGHEFDWYDLEMKKFFGIDIYETPFDKEKGWQIYKNGNVELLVYKLEKLSGLETVIREFTGRKELKLSNDNESKGKNYKFIYDEFIKGEKLPDEYIDFYYKENPKMDYFYSGEEKENFLKKWRKIG